MRLHAWIYKSIWTFLFVTFFIIGYIKYDISLRNENKNIYKYTFKQPEEIKKPAVTFCHESKVSLHKVDKVLGTMKMDRNDSVRNDFVSALEVLSSLDNNSGLIDNLSPGAIMILNDHRDQLPDILNQVR